MKPGRAPQMRGWDFGRAPELQRPLNDALTALSDRIAALETAANVVALEPFEITTGAVISVGSAPFPVYVNLPAGGGRDLAGVVVLRVESLTNTGTAGMVTTAYHAEWEVDTESQRLVIQYVSSLQVTTNIRITLGAVYA